jgi:L-cysteine S-thiosulfotransferase
MNARIVLAGMAAALVASLGCAPATKTGRGFHLPAGNAEQGKLAFIQLNCNSCHRVDGVELPPPYEKPTVIVDLGGEVTYLRTYGDLVTSIIHPDREISNLLPPDYPRPVTKSPMKNVNQQMTVAQMIDIVTFLEPRYRQLLPVFEHTAD